MTGFLLRLHDHSLWSNATSPKHRNFTLLYSNRVAKVRVVNISNSDEFLGGKNKEYETKDNVKYEIYELRSSTLTGLPMCTGLP